MVDSHAFADQWLAAWNARDLDAVLALFHDDVIFTSPLAQKIVPDSDGVIHGKEALRAYWSAALAQAPDLQFALTRLLAGIDTLVIGFTVNGPPERFEILRFRGNRIGEGHGTYPVEV